MMPEQNEPSTGEIIDDLKALARISPQWSPICRIATATIQAQEHTIADKEAKIAELTERAERAEKLVKRYEDNIDRQNADYRTW